MIVANPTFDLDISETPDLLEGIILLNNKLMNFTVKANSILSTDPKRSVIWWVE